MNKHTIIVPRGIRYISNWEEFNSIFPQHQHILDKSITGCGFTEWCLTNPMNVVLCSPRNILLDNKAEQHPGEVYRIRSPYFDKELGVDKDTSEPPTKKLEDMEPDNDESKIPPAVAKESAYERISRELDEYSLKRNTLPRKILVTYDSFHVLHDVLKSKGTLESYFIIVDEFQSVFTDSRFKAGIEMEFVRYLKDLERVCYLSATPMLDRYLEDMPDFKDLPFYKLDWESLDPGRVMKPNLMVKAVKNIYVPAKRIIDAYKKGDYQISYRKSPKTGEPEAIESREAVFYVNSVTNIVRIIEQNKLEAEECNILCAKTDKNERRIKSMLGTRFRIGRVPLEDEPRKMFTFCTRTVYLGADFYSSNARTFILSDANIECLAVDISLDLPQIMGRQRNWDNPWKNDAEFYYRPLTGDKKIELDPGEFERKIQEKMDITMGKLANWKEAPRKDVMLRSLTEDVICKNYRDDYICINTRAEKYPKPEINYLVLIAERRAFDVQQTDYKDRFSVINAMYLDTDGPMAEVTAFFLEYDRLTTIYDKLYFLCEANLSDKAREFVENQIDSRIKSYLTLGKDRIRALGYNSTRLNKELGLKSSKEIQEELSIKVYENFFVGDRLSKADIKSSLGKIYEDLGIKKTAKASDLDNWFEVKSCQFRSNGKVVHGFDIVNKKR